jgi:hypothetical protein
MMIKRALQPEQWQVLHRLHSVGCPVDDQHLPTPLHVFAELGDTKILRVSGRTLIALAVRVVATTSITIRRFRLRADWSKGEISLLGFCSQHRGDPQKHYCFPEGSWNDRYSSEDVLNHRTLHSGVLKRGGFLSGFLLGTYKYKPPPMGIGAKVQTTLCIEDLCEHEYRFPIVLFDHTSEDDWEDWECQRASAREGTVMPLTGDKDELM